jgi:ATP-dependent Clp protease ATP-binding subunit ClpB
MAEIDFSKFTDNARRTISMSFSRAKALNHREISPQIMMSVLVEEGRDMVYYLLRAMDVDRVAFCQAVTDAIPTSGRNAAGSVPISRQLEEVLKKALALSEESHSSIAALEHIFWAFSVVPGPVRDIMRRFSITDSKVAGAIAGFRRGSSGSEEGTQNADGNEPRALQRYARNLTKSAQEGRLEPVVGRDDETRRILQILSRKTKNNPILVGEPGTGKTAVVEGLAHRLIRGDVPRNLEGLKLYALDITALIAGASYQGEFEARIKKVIKEVKEDPRIILFIDEIHLLIGAGRTGGAMDAANILKPELARGEIKVIGATTTDEYTKYIESDKAFERRFQKVVVSEPDEDDAITIMRGIKQRFESFHRIKILDEAIVSAVKLSHRYIPERFLPDKAIDLLDEAASRMRIERSSVPVELDELSRIIRSKEMERESLRQDEQEHDLTELDREIDNLREKENALNAKWRNERILFEEVQRLRDEVEQLRRSSEQAENDGHYEDAVMQKARIQAINDRIAVLLNTTETSLLKTALDDDDIRQVVTAWTGIPVQKLKQDESEKLLQLDTVLSSSVIGQTGAVAAVSKVIRRNKMGFGDSGRPVGSFLFLGTTGVGKTELAKVLAEYLFNSREMIVRIDMSEYQQEFSVSRLFGAPPGYVGYDQGGQLTEAVRHRPYSVVLLDEIEKAHPKVFETLLQVLDDGRMTDGQGRTVDFKNTIIIMTSNMKMEEINMRMPPEFLNRIDDTVYFNELSMDDIRKICVLQLSRLREKLMANGLKVSFTDSAVDLLAILSYEPRFGARPVKRTINDRIVNGLTTCLLNQELDRTREISVSSDGNDFVFVND